jgi:hypothetical protein
MQLATLYGSPFLIPSLEKGGSDRRARSKRRCGEGSFGGASAPSRVKGALCCPTSPNAGARKREAERVGGLIPRALHSGGVRNA